MRRLREHSPAFDGLYSPEDMLWRVNRELLIGPAGPRALLLELAHPKVAQGVAEHSHFRTRPLRRLTNTVRMMQLLSFGTMHAARLAARHTYECHRPVHGEGYDANDPELRLWVFATLIDSILAAHDVFVRPLTEADKAAYYDDSKRMAGLLGVPPHLMPPGYSDLTEYVHTMISNGTVQVSPAAREVVAALFSQPLWGRPTRVATFFGVGLLPGGLREEFGFRWTDTHQRRFHDLAALSRRMRAFLPEFLVAQPMTWLTYYRWQLSQARHPSTGRRQPR